jgi:hypothetical protein
MGILFVGKLPGPTTRVVTLTNMKLDSAPLYPTNLATKDLPTNLVLNKTPAGKYQVARVLKPGGPKEGEFEILVTADSEQECRTFARQQVEKDSPGLL